MGRMYCVWTGYLRASDICAFATEFRLPVARTWRALCTRMRIYRACVCVCVFVCVWKCTAQLLLAVTCSYTRLAVVGSNNIPTYFLTLLPSFDKSAPCIFNTSHVRYPPHLASTLKKEYGYSLLPRVCRRERFKGELHLLP